MVKPLTTIYSSPPYSQQFLLPDNIIYYITKNPSSPKLWNKIVKMCKYFYLTNPLITLRHLFRTTVQVYYRSPRRYCWKISEINGLNTSSKPYKIDIFSIIKKPWITVDFSAYTCEDDGDYQKWASLVASKLDQCDISTLSLRLQILTLNEFKLFNPSKLCNIYFSFTIVKYDDGSIVPIEVLVEQCPNLEALRISFPYDDDDDDDKYIKQCITPKTAENLIAIPHFQNLQHFSIDNAPEGFGIEELFDGLKRPIKMEMNLQFAAGLSDQYTARLQTFVDKLVEKGLTEDFPPTITFNGMSDESNGALQDLSYDHYLAYVKPKESTNES